MDTQVTILIVSAFVTAVTGLTCAVVGFMIKRDIGKVEDSVKDARTSFKIDFAEIRTQFETFNRRDHEFDLTLVDVRARLLALERERDFYRQFLPGPIQMATNVMSKLPEAASSPNAKKDEPKP